MSGLFGYYDPQHVLPPDAAEAMARAIAVEVDRSIMVLRGRSFAIGCASKGIYPGEGQVLTSHRSRRYGLYVGRLLGFDGDDQSDAVTAARTAFLDAPTPSRLASANGPFAAAIWDGGAGCLELITDRYGMYPIYAAGYGSALLFAQQIKAVMAPGVVAAEIDPVALVLMAAIGELVGDLTPLRTVRLLPAACKIAIGEKGLTHHPYWHYDFGRMKEPAETFRQTAQRTGRLLRHAVRRICNVTPAVGVPLSGGLDSRVLLAAVPDPGRTPSFTWGIRGCRDLAYAQAVAAVLGSPHRSFEFDGGYLQECAALGVWLTEGQLPCTDFHVLPFVKHVAQRCQVILNGYAGDAVLGGNFIMPAWRHADRPQEAATALWRWRNGAVAETYRGSLLGPRLISHGWESARSSFIEQYVRSPGTTPMDMAMAFLLDNRVRRRTSGGTNLMRWAVESDQPFFDNDLFDHLAQLPYAWRFRHRLYVEVLRECFPAAASVRWQRTGLPAGAPFWTAWLSLAAHRLVRTTPLAAFQKRKAVSNFAGWMRGPLRGLVQTTLLSRQALDRNLFDPAAVRRIVNDHMDGRADNSTLLGHLLAIELFCRLFIDADRSLLDGQLTARTVPAESVNAEAIERSLLPYKDNAGLTAPG